MTFPKDTDKKEDKDLSVSNAEVLKYFAPLIQILKELGGSATRKEAHEKVIELMDITEEELSVTYEKSGDSQVLKNIDFARNDLAYEGFISKGTRGVWALTELGMSIDMTMELAGLIHMKWVKINTAKRKGEPIPEIDLSKYYKKKADLKYTKADFLEEVFITESEYDKLCSLVLRKKNLILQGAPGVGKTFSAKRLAYSIIGEKNESRICMVQFHQNYKEANFDAIKSKAERLGKEITQLSGLVNYLKQFVQFFSADSIADLNETKKTWAEAEQEQKAAQILFSESASDLDKESISNLAWKALWKDANNYYETILKAKGIARYTEEQGMCPLCGQEIKDLEHVHRMKSIDEYVNGNVSQKVNNAKKLYLTSLKKCPRAWENSQLQLMIDACGLESEKEDVINCTNLIFNISNKIHSDEIETVEISAIDVVSVVKNLEEKQQFKQADKKASEELLQDDDHKKLIDEVNELKARKYASTIKSRVNNRIEFLQIAKQHDDAVKLTGTNKITTKSKALGEELITGDYVKRFNDELKILTKGTVKASLKQQKASKGKIPFKIVLADVQDEKTNPEDIFSEGEKRVVSLAAFFAESSGRNTECPLIVDDPISSLDLKYEALVIDRLIEASKHRQVIVFTHRLSMVVGLYDKCGKEIPFVERELLGRRTNKGIPVESAHNGGQSLGKLKNIRNENIAKLKKMDDSTVEYIQGIHYVCQQIRIHVEKSVEDTLLNGIVLRYRKDVQTNNRIKWLAEINEEDCKIIDEMMTKYSYYDHSMSDEMPLQEFPLNEVEADLDKLIKWLEGIKKRQKEQK